MSVNPPFIEIEICLDNVWVAYNITPMGGQGTTTMNGDNMGSATTTILSTMVSENDECMCSVGPLAISVSVLGALVGVLILMLVITMALLCVAVNKLIKKSRLKTDSRQEINIPLYMYDYCQLQSMTGMKYTSYCPQTKAVSYHQLTERSDKAMCIS